MGNHIFVKAIASYISNTFLYLTKLNGFICKHLFVYPEKKFFFFLTEKLSNFQMLSWYL